MKLVCSFLVLGMFLGGCSTSGMLSSLGMGPSNPSPAANNIQVGNALAMPPDLQLRPPGTAPAPVPAPAYQPKVASASTPADSNALYSTPAPGPVATAPKQDIYAQYGISKVKPDGTAKTHEELQAELKVAVLKKKQQQQPGYGTVKNIGNIFSNG